MLFAQETSRSPCAGLNTLERVGNSLSCPLTAIGVICTSRAFSILQWRVRRSPEVRSMTVDKSPAILLDGLYELSPVKLRITGAPQMNRLTSPGRQGGQAIIGATRPSKCARIGSAASGPRHVSTSPTSVLAAWANVVAPPFP